MNWLKAPGRLLQKLIRISFRHNYFRPPVADNGVPRGLAIIMASFFEVSRLGT